MDAPVIDMEEELGALFGDDDFEDDASDGFDKEEVWEVNEEWLMAPTTPPPMLAVPPPSVYEVGGPSIATVEGSSYPYSATRLLVPLAVIEDLSTRLDVYEGELTLRVDNEAITYNLDQTSRYSVNYNDMTANRIDVVELACEEYSQEVLGFSDVISSGNPTPGYDPIVLISSPTLTPFGDSDFLLLEEADAFLALANDPTSPEELKICEAKTAKSSIDEPPEVELKDSPPHLKYAFLEDNNKFPVIISKDLSVDEKTALIKERHFPLPFMDQMLRARMEMNTIVFSRWFLVRLPFAYRNALGTSEFSEFIFQRAFANLEKMLNGVGRHNLALNGKKPFYGKEGIVLDIKISKKE
ncbi:hypothetical protein Tco_0687582 [Tanacetum coccineum]